MTDFTDDAGTRSTPIKLLKPKSQPKAQQEPKLEDLAEQGVQIKAYKKYL